MAEETKKNVPENDVPKVAAEESSATDRELLKKKEEEEEEKKTSLVENLNLSDSSSSFSLEYASNENLHQSPPPSYAVDGRRSQSPPTVVAKEPPSPIFDPYSAFEPCSGFARRRPMLESENVEKRKTSKGEGNAETEKEKRGFLEKMKEKLPGYVKKPKVDHTSDAAAVISPYYSSNGSGNASGGEKEIVRKNQGEEGKGIAG